MTMASSRAFQAGQYLRKVRKFDYLLDEGAHLPQAYKKFYTEWKFQEATPVHYRHNTKVSWAKMDNGEVKRVDDFPIPLIFPPESHKGIWGGEAVVKGFQKRQRLKQRVPHFWVPDLKKSAVHSEILNQTMGMTVTERTIDLIIQNHGFDHYILKTAACDLQSSLALKLKKKMLHALFHKQLYPDDPVKRDSIYNKYKHYLDDYTEEEIEWYGLTFDEALRKYEADHKIKPEPLKHQLRIKLIQSLMVPSEKEIVEDSSTSKWINRLNPFSKEAKE